MFQQEQQLEQCGIQRHLKIIIKMSHFLPSSYSALHIFTHIVMSGQIPEEQ